MQPLYKKYMLCIVGCFFLAGCQKKKLWDSFLLPTLSHTIIPHSKTEEKTIVILFIHGTMLSNPKPHANNNRLIGIYDHQIIDKIGIHPINNEKNNTYGSLIALENYTKSYQSLHGTKANIVAYAGGWDGRLNQQNRLRWAKNLYIEFLQQLKKDGLWNKPNIEIEIHGFSHGGNVALNFAQAETDLKQKLTIDRLCLWGMPVQEETAHLVHHPLFKEIYHFYSEKDKTQVIDIFSTIRRRSYKNFKKVLSNIPQKLYQISLEINGFYPNHYEFWYLGTVGTFYRAAFPLAPYPLTHFTPLFIELIKQNNPPYSYIKIVGKRTEKKLRLSLKPLQPLQSFFTTHQAISLLCLLDNYGVSTTKKIFAKNKR